MHKHEKLSDDYKMLIHKDTQNENGEITLKSRKSPRKKVGCPGSIVRSSNTYDITEGFRRFLTIDLALTNLTATNHVWKLKVMLENISKPVNGINKEDVRSFLQAVKEKYSANTYACFIKTIRRFFRDYLNRSELATFKFPTIPFTPKMLMFNKEDLQRFYESIQHPVVKMLFLGYCVTGLRRSDLLFLMKDELSTRDQMIIKNNSSTTKHRWATFYNNE